MRLGVFCVVLKGYSCEESVSPVDCPSALFSREEGVFLASKNNTKPMANRTGSGIKLMFIHVPCERGKKIPKILVKPRPRIAALLPKISYTPKNSPVLSAGISLVK